MSSEVVSNNDRSQNEQRQPQVDPQVHPAFNRVISASRPAGIGMARRHAIVQSGRSKFCSRSRR
jgi:hypothetical protein